MRFHICIAITFICSIGGAQQRPIESEKICLPVGSKDFNSMGATNLNRAFFLKKNVDVGPAVFRDGCKIRFQTQHEQSNFDTDAAMEKERSIASADCAKQNASFSLGGIEIRYASFDPNGCIHGSAGLKSSVQICGKRWDIERPLIFVHGKLHCEMTTVPEE